MRGCLGLILLTVPEFTFESAWSNERAANASFGQSGLKAAPSELIGAIELWPDDGSHDQRGFWIASEFQGRGLMTEAADRVTEYAFLQLGWPQLWLTNAADNIASRRVKERQGAQLVNTVDKQYVSGKSSGEVWLLKSEDWTRRRNI